MFAYVTQICFEIQNVQVKSFICLLYVFDLNSCLKNSVKKYELLQELGLFFLCIKPVGYGLDHRKKQTQPVKTMIL